MSDEDGMRARIRIVEDEGIVALDREKTLSEPGRDSEFRVVLPPATTPPSPSPEPAPTTESAKPPRGRVLVIDDEPLVAQAITRVLSTLHEVTAVQSGRAAVALLTGGETFDVVLCDLMMPGMGGAQVYEWIESKRPDLLPRFVFLTGGATDPKSADLLASMPNATVEKPFSPTSLRALVTEFVTRPRK